MDRVRGIRVHNCSGMVFRFMINMPFNGRTLGYTGQFSAGYFKTIELNGSDAPPNGTEIWPMMEYASANPDYPGHHEAGQNCIFDPKSNVVGVYNVTGIWGYPSFSYQGVSSDDVTPVSAPVAPAPTQAPVHNEGDRLHKDGMLYLVLDGLARHIPNPETYNLLFADWDGYLETANLGPVGAPLSDKASLVKTPSDGKIYLVCDGKRRWISNAAVFDRYHFNWNTPQAPSPAFMALPIGSKLV